jgi:hypothetical protein
MSLFTIVSPPRPTSAPEQYDQGFMAQMQNILNLFFQQVNAVQPINIAKLNIDLATLPTEAALTTLRKGDVYRDTTAGNALKVKV